MNRFSRGESLMRGGKTLLGLFEDFLREQNWEWERVEGHNALRFAFKGDNGSWLCFVAAREEENQIVFYSVLEENVPEHKRIAMAELLTRANYGLVFGNFEMDFEDGELRFKTSLDGGDGEISPESIKPLLFGNILVMDKYLPGVHSLLHTDIAPKDALKLVETDENNEY